MSAPGIKPPPALMQGGIAGPTLSTSQSSFELQELWFILQRKPWKSLVLVPGHAEGSSLPIAAALAEIGRMNRGRSVVLVNAEQLDLSRTAQVIADLDAPPSTSWSSGGGGGSAMGADQAGRKVLVALEPVVRNPLGMAIAMAADAVVLCIELGRSDIASAKRTLELIGREKVLGTVLLRRER